MPPKRHSQPGAGRVRRKCKLVRLRRTVRGHAVGSRKRDSGSCRELCLLRDRFCMGFATVFFASQIQYNAAALSANSQTCVGMMPLPGTPQASLPLLPYFFVARDTSNATSAPFTHTTSLSSAPTTGRNSAVATTSARTNALMVFSSVATQSRCP
jgi:hypothetical protein